MKDIKKCFVVAISFTLFSTGCLPSFVKNEAKAWINKKISISAIEQFNEKLNERKFKELCDETSNDFDQNIGTENCPKFFETIIKNLGTRENAVLEDTHSNPDGEYIWLNYRTRFELDDGFEEISFQVKNNQPKLRWYYFVSKNFNSSSHP